MNELLFVFHVLCVLGFGLGALRLGASGLTAWAALQAVLANLFVIKQIEFFGFHITCSDVFAVGSILSVNLLREYYGKEASSRALWVCFYLMVFFVAMAQFHLGYTPSPLDTTQSAFTLLLSPSPRLLFTSLGVFFFVQQLDLILFGRLQKKWPNVSLGLRNGVSLSLTQFIDTVLFSVIGLWGLVGHLTDIIVVSFLVKLLVIFLITPFLSFSRRFVNE